MPLFVILLLNVAFVGCRAQLSDEIVKGSPWIDILQGTPWTKTSKSCCPWSAKRHSPPHPRTTLRQLLFALNPRVARNPSRKFRSRIAMNEDSSNSASRRAVLSTIFGMSFVPYASFGTVPSTGKSSSFKVYDVLSAPLDPRSYRGLILSNGLRVLLASDPKTADSAASMTVQVGYLSDPVGFPGLAHFCEHMLFLGSKQFPKEGDFKSVVASGGGSDNAFTAIDETNYYFDVEGSLLKPALARFAGFFTGPLFTASATSREVNAIDSEHSKNLQSDFWRYGQLLKLWANQSHPYAKFGTGTRKTLREGDSSAREALLKFHERYYQADRMGLALIGPQPLDFLQNLAVDKFAAIPSSDPPLPPSSAEYDDLPIPFQPSKKAAEALLMVPVKDQRTLKFRWCLPITDFDDLLATSPQEVWSLLMNRRDKGGLLALLKRESLALSLSAGVDEVTKSWILLAVDISLEPSGLTKWRDVASLLFAYLRKMRDVGVPQTLLEEFRLLGKIGFEYSEPIAPQAWAEGSSGQLDLYPPEKWITRSAFIEEGSEVGVGYFLRECADPANAMITLVARSNEDQATYVEPIYGTKYGKLSLTREIDSWRKGSIPADFAPLGPNPFIPTDFAIKCESGGRVCVAPSNDGSLRPQVLNDISGLRVHFLQDSTFRRPIGAAFFSFRSPLFVASPKKSLTASLFTSVLGDVLQDLTYQAGLAGMSAGVSADFNGFSLAASGYSSRLRDIVEFVGNKVRTAELTAIAFNRQREAARKQIANFKFQQPYALCDYYRRLATETLRFTNEEMLDAVEASALSDVLDFQKSLLPDTYLEAFLIGNLEENEAREMVDIVQKALPSSAPLPADKFPRRQIKALEPGKRYLQQFVTPNPSEENSAVEVYLQIGADEDDNWLLLGFLDVLMQESFFEELRTKQQLGYVVQSSVDESEDVRGLVLRIQSNVFPPPVIEERIDTFLKQYRAELATLSNSEFKQLQKSLVSQVTDVDKRLDGQAGRLWKEMVKRRYDYSRPWRVRDRLRTITKNQLLAFYDRFIVPGAPDRRQLSSHVFASRIAPGNLVIDTVPDNFYPAPPERSLLDEVVQGKTIKA